jgi:hypothetical protein
VRFDEEAFAEDLAHASPAGRAVAERERSRLERDGIAPNELRACEPEARDGTRLPGCATTYLPAPDGHRRLVAQGRIARDPGRARPDARRPPAIRRRSSASSSM